MADIEKEVEALIYTGLGDGEPDSEAERNPPPLEDATAEPEQEEETEKRRVIDVDLYRLPGGAVLLVPGQGTHPLEANAVESDAPQQATTVAPEIDPLEETVAGQQEATIEPEITTTPTTPLALARKRLRLPPCWRRLCSCCSLQGEQPVTCSCRRLPQRQP